MATAYQLQWLTTYPTNYTGDSLMYHLQWRLLTNENGDSLPITVVTAYQRQRQKLINYNDESLLTTVATATVVKAYRLQ